MHCFILSCRCSSLCTLGTRPMDSTNTSHCHPTSENTVSVLFSLFLLYFLFLFFPLPPLPSSSSFSHPLERSRKRVIRMTKLLISSIVFSLLQTIWSVFFLFPPFKTAVGELVWWCVLYNLVVATSLCQTLVFRLSTANSSGETETGSRAGTKGRSTRSVALTSSTSGNASRESEGGE